MFDLLFIISIVGVTVQVIKEICTPEVPIKDMKSKFGEPYRNPKNGKIVIQNCDLYYDDVDKYGACQAQCWAKQGKYNL